MPTLTPTVFRQSFVTGLPVPRFQFSANGQYVTFTNARQSVDSFGNHTYATVTRTFKRPVISPSTATFTPTGTIYYVQNDGDNLNSGLSMSSPFQTVTRALAAVTNPGDAIYIKRGTYTEQLPFIGFSGTSGNPIIITCYPGDEGLVYFTLLPASVLADPWRSVITLNGCSYLWINGLCLQGARGMPGAPVAGQDSLAACGLYIANGSGPGCRFTNLVCYQSTHCGLKEPGHGGKGFTVEGCLSLDNGIASVDHGIYLATPDMTGTVINGNIFTDNFGAGIHNYPTTSNLTVTRNLCLGHIQNILQAGATSTIQYNTCSGGYCGLMWYNAGCVGNAIDHNIFASCSTFSQVKSGTPGVNTENFNCNFGGASGTDSVTPGANDIASDPQFVNANGGDFTLTGGSPATTMGCYA